VTAAQALTSGLFSSSPSVRSRDGVRLERNDASFRDALDQASQSSTRSAEDASSGSSRAQRASDRTASNQDTRAEAKAEDRDDGSNDERADREGARPAEQAGVTGLSLVLAALGSGAEDGPPDGSFDAASIDGQQALADLLTAGRPSTEAAEQGPWMPTEAGAEVPDAERLLQILNSEAPDVGAEGGVIVEAKATVTAQETHLAMSVRSDAEAALAAQDGTRTADAAPDGADSGMPSLVKAAIDGAREGTERGRDTGASEGPAPDVEAGAGRRTVAATTPGAHEGRGSAFADQGRAGSDDRQQDGRGSSGGTSQGSAGVFGSVVNGTAMQPARAADDDASQVFVPVSEQIADEVRAELRADGLGETSSEGVVKVLQIELKPANLGSVTVRLALKDNQITVHLEAQNRDTLTAIQRERDALVGALTSAGYAVDGITTAQTDVARTSGAQAGFGDQGSANQGAPQGQPNQGQGLANSSGQQGREQRSHFEGRDQARPSDGKDIASGGLRSKADGLYV